MAPYCIVCNQDLALDSTAVPPLCGKHAREKQAEEQRRAKLADLTSLRTVTLHTYASVREGGMLNGRGTFGIYADEYDEDGEFIQRFVVKKIEYKATTPPYKHYGNYKPSWSANDARPAYAELASVHRDLVRVGWRPFPGTVRINPPSELTPKPGLDHIRGAAHSTVVSDVSRFESWGQKRYGIHGSTYVYAYMPRVDENYLWRLIKGTGPEITTPAPRKKLFGVF